MYPFFALSLRIQQASLQAAASAGAMMLEAYTRALHQQFAFLDHMHAYRRPEDHPFALYFAAAIPKARTGKGTKGKAGKVRSPCHGPDLTNHYGHRAHDVDVEHI
ncbi:MAG: hypothetical protein H8E39_06170 [Alphaproteobacteria bacterium]|nr:hypothetical protein [Alphaproteobacteria bacterium]